MFLTSAGPGNICCGLWRRIQSRDWHEWGNEGLERSRSPWCFDVCFWIVWIGVV